MGGYLAVVDYGAGNLLSVTKALEYLGFSARVCGDAAGIDGADGVILPGVGAFPDAMAHLRARGLEPVLCRNAEKKPLLGICLGMQMLLTDSEEVRPCTGLGLIPGHVRRIKTALKLPQIGWNSLQIVNPNPLTASLHDGDFVYFVHSYAGFVDEEADLAMTTDYGVPVTAMVARGNLFGCQFHPEKSGELGLTILKHFGDLTR